MLPVQGELLISADGSTRFTAEGVALQTDETGMWFVQGRYDSATGTLHGRRTDVCGLLGG